MTPPEPNIKMVLNTRETKLYLDDAPFTKDERYRAHKERVAREYAVASEQPVDLYTVDEQKVVYHAPFPPTKE